MSIVTTIKKFANIDEVVYDFFDIENKSYIELFSDNSVYLRYFKQFEQPFSKIEYLDMKKQQRENKITRVSLSEKYPKIINDKIHKNAIIVKHINKLDKYEKIIFCKKKSTFFMLMTKKTYFFHIFFSLKKNLSKKCVQFSEPQFF